MGIDITEWSARFAESLPRRSLIGMLGKATAAAGVLMVGLHGTAHADCSTCGGCNDGTPCGGMASTCCPNCSPYAGRWCGGNPGQWGGDCSVGGCPAGWFWYCCNPISCGKIKCQDCCCSSGTCTTLVTVGQCTNCAPTG